MPALMKKAISLHVGFSKCWPVHGRERDDERARLLSSSTVSDLPSDSGVGVTIGMKPKSGHMDLR